MTGFLSPKGEFKKCRNMGHGKLALKILNNPYLFETEAEDKLFNKGWVCLTGGYATLDLMHKNVISDNQIKWYEENYSKLTKIQINDFEKMKDKKNRLNT